MSDTEVYPSSNTGPTQARITVKCRNDHEFTTNARPGSSISCPKCRTDGKGRVAVWVPRQTATATAETADQPTGEAPASVAEQRSTRDLLAAILAEQREISARLYALEIDLKEVLPMVRRGAQADDMDAHLAAIEANQAAHDQHTRERRKTAANEQSKALIALVPADESGRCLVTYKTAQVALRCTQYQARQALTNLESHGLATPVERRGNQPQTWEVFANQATD